MVADDHKKIQVAHFNEGLKKFASDFEYEFDDNVHCLIVHPIGSLLFGLKKDKSWFVFDLEEVWVGFIRNDLCMSKPRKAFTLVL